jgi:hypothetical protein
VRATGTLEVEVGPAVGHEHVHVSAVGHRHLAVGVEASRPQHGVALVDVHRPLVSLARGDGDQPSCELERR